MRYFKEDPGKTEIQEKIRGELLEFEKILVSLQYQNH